MFSDKLSSTIFCLGFGSTLFKKHKFLLQSEICVFYFIDRIYHYLTGCRKERVLVLLVSQSASPFC